MAFNIYNLKNQALNADKNRDLSYFSTNNFGGIISDIYEPLNVYTDRITWNQGLVFPIKFMAGGLVIECTDNLNFKFEGTSNLLALEVKLDSSNTTIAHDRMEDINGRSLISIKAFEVINPRLSDSYSVLSVVDIPESNPKIHEYYYYDGVTQSYKPSQSTVVEPGVVYYARVISQSLTFTMNYGTSNLNLNYYGNTVWLDKNTFIIPLCVKINDVVSSVVSVKSKEDIDGLMSMANYRKLKNYVDSNFVWHEGGQGFAGDGGYDKGDIGDLNITHNVIAHKAHIEEDVTEPVKISDLAIMSLADAQNSANSKVMVDTDGRLSVDPYYKTPVAAGGTYLPSNWNSNNPRLSAKQNLGITYGSGAPQTTNNTMEGDIYFRIVDGSEIEPPKKTEPVVSYNYDYSWISSLSNVSTPVTVTPEPDPTPETYKIKVTAPAASNKYIRAVTDEGVKIADTGTKQKTGTEQLNVYATEGDSVIIKAPAVSGKTFAGWKDETGKIVSKDANYTISSVDSNVTLKATYKTTKTTTKKKK